MYSTDIANIHCIKFNTELRIVDNQEACVPILRIVSHSHPDSAVISKPSSFLNYSQLITGDSSLVEWPDLVIMDTKGPKHRRGINGIVFEVRCWLRCLGWDLVSPDNESNYFHLTQHDLSDFFEPFSPSLKRESKTSIGNALKNLNLNSSSIVPDGLWNIMESFARVKHIAKDKSNEVLQHPATQKTLQMFPQNLRSPILQSFFDDYGDDVGAYAKTSNGITRKAVHTDSFDWERLTYGLNSTFTGKPVTIDQWDNWQDDQGILNVDFTFIMARIFSGGVEDDLRIVVWAFLFNIYPWKSTRLERDAIDTNNNGKYNMLRQSWINTLKDGLHRVDVLRAVEGTENVNVGDENQFSDNLSRLLDRKNRIEKDVVRSDTMFEPDSTYPTLDVDGNRIKTISNSMLAQKSPHDLLETLQHCYGIESHDDAHTAALLKLRNILMTFATSNTENGYVQGMTDLLTPLLTTFKSESKTYIAYTAFMERMVHLVFI